MIEEAELSSLKKSLRSVKCTWLSGFVSAFVVGWNGTDSGVTNSRVLKVV